jgi:hypothetical protein
MGAAPAATGRSVLGHNTLPDDLLETYVAAVVAADETRSVDSRLASAARALLLAADVPAAAEGSGWISLDFAQAQRCLHALLQCITARRSGASSPLVSVPAPELPTPLTPVAAAIRGLPYPLQYGGADFSTDTLRLARHISGADGCDGKQACPSDLLHESMSLTHTVEARIADALAAAVKALVAVYGAATNANKRASITESARTAWQAFAVTLRQTTEAVQSAAQSALTRCQAATPACGHMSEPELVASQNALSAALGVALSKASAAVGAAAACLGAEAIGEATIAATVDADTVALQLVSLGSTLSDWCFDSVPADCPLDISDRLCVLPVSALAEGGDDEPLDARRTRLGLSREACLRLEPIRAKHIVEAAKGETEALEHRLLELQTKQKEADATDALNPPADKKEKDRRAVARRTAEDKYRAVQNELKRQRARVDRFDPRVSAPLEKVCFCPSPFASFLLIRCVPEPDKSHPFPFLPLLSRSASSADSSDATKKTARALQALSEAQSAAVHIAHSITAALASVVWSLCDAVHAMQVAGVLHRMTTVTDALRQALSCTSTDGANIALSYLIRDRCRDRVLHWFADYTASKEKQHEEEVARKNAAIALAAAKEAAIATAARPSSVPRGVAPKVAPVAHTAPSAPKSSRVPAVHGPSLDAFLPEAPTATGQTAGRRKGGTQAAQASSLNAGMDEEAALLAAVAASTAEADAQQAYLDAADSQLLVQFSDEELRSMLAQAEAHSTGGSHAPILPKSNEPDPAAKFRPTLRLEEVIIAGHGGARRKRRGSTATSSPALPPKEALDLASLSVDLSTLTLDGGAQGLVEGNGAETEADNNDAEWTVAKTKGGKKANGRRVALDARIATDATVGLGNRYGENNCFLNVVVQSLFRLTTFRKMLEGSLGFLKKKLTTAGGLTGLGDAEKASFALLKTLHDSFEAMDASGHSQPPHSQSTMDISHATIVSLNPLRRALAMALLQKQIAEAAQRKGQFVSDVLLSTLQDREMADASEVMEEIISLIHESEARLWSSLGGIGGTVFNSANGMAALVEKGSLGLNTNLSADISAPASSALAGFGLLFQDVQICKNAKCSTINKSPQFTSLALHVNVYDFVSVKRRLSMIQTLAAVTTPRKEVKVGTPASGTSSISKIEINGPSSNSASAIPPVVTTPNFSVVLADTIRTSENKSCDKCSFRPCDTARFLLRPTPYVTVVMGWASGNEPNEILKPAIDSIDGYIDLARIFRLPMPAGTPHRPLPAKLKGLVCYTANHWVALFEKDGSWVCFNDENVFPAPHPMTMCLRARLQPSLLFYECGQIGDKLPADLGREDLFAPPEVFPAAVHNVALAETDFPSLSSAK